MYCINPIYLEGRGIFPCGQCRYCRVMRSNNWAMRMMHESNYWDDRVFVTLTYNNEWLPADGNLDKPELQKFLKRLRKAIEPRKLKYFACGEYGATYGRPHYHLILFGVGYNLCDKIIIERAWQQGYIKLGPVNRKSCKYVSKYVTKAPLGRSRKERHEYQRSPEWQLASHGIGLSWIMERSETVGTTGISYHGRQVCLPRYYVNKLSEEGVCAQVIEDAKAVRMQDVIERYKRWAAAGFVSADECRELSERITARRIEELKTLDSLYGGRDDQ